MIAMVAFRGGRWYNCCWCPFGSLMCAGLVVALSGGGIGCRVLDWGAPGIVRFMSFSCFPAALRCLSGGCS